MHYALCQILSLCLVVLEPPSLQAQQDSTIAADSILIRQLQQEISAPALSTPQSSPRSAPSTNPNMSVIGDVRASYVSPARRHGDVEFHEAELALQSVVDPYARADFFLSVARDPGGGSFGLDLEEAFLTSLDLPARLQLKAGKFRSTFGKINTVHPHALSFISAPDAFVRYLGEDGLNDEGLSVSWLVPNPLDFYQELTVEMTRGPDNNPSFVRSDVDRYLYLGHLKNFWDLTDNATLELGFSCAAGQNYSAYATVLGGIDVTYKWKPLQFNTYQSLVVQGEAIWSNKRLSGNETVNSWGMYVLATVQLDRRWFLTGRFDYSNIPTSSSLVERAVAGVLGWYATEFQKIELECKGTTSNFSPTVNQVLLRSVFVIGAHGAHAY